MKNAIDHQFSWGAVLLATLVAAGPELVAPAPGAGAEKPLRIEVLPRHIVLDHGKDVQRVVVVAHYPGQSTRDVTGEAALILADPDCATITEEFRLAPAHSGETVLTAEFGGRVAQARVEVRNAGVTPPVSFHRDVIPVLTRAGCNSGACHGSAAGKNGFGLSLFGFDPATDHQRLTRELRGRRINPAWPEDSLLLTKPTTEVSHRGGRRLEAEGALYGTIEEWIAAGAPLDRPADPPLRALEVLPAEIVLDGADQTQRILVRAIYADGSDRDVTDLALLSSTNAGVAAIEGDRIRSGEPGEAFVMARFGTLAEVAQIIVRSTEGSFSWPAPAELSDVDGPIHAKLLRMRIVPADLCTDEVFLRRVSLDVLNVLPTVEETTSFLADEDPLKRAKLVDRLLARPEFPDVWAMQWSEVLRVESEKLERKGMYAYTRYLRDSFARDVPLNEMVGELLVAEGGNFANPAANFYLTDSDPKAIAENVAQVFLGIRIQCAQCHNHPFERWTMDDYYGFAAFFAQVATKRGEDPRERVVYHLGSGVVRHKRDNRPVAPRYLGGDEAEVPRGGDPRALLASWMTADDNAWFAANIANRVWARFFGRGIVEPPDDVRVSNPPSHPELHRMLGRKLVAGHYDLRSLIRDICTSRTYQLATSRGEAPASAFAGAAVRRLTAEQLLDAITQVTGVPTKYPGLPLGARATQVADGDPRNVFLDVFGRPRRTTSCTCERRSDPTLGQALHLINGDTLAAKIKDPKGRLHRQIAGKASDAEIISDLYLAAYCREPRPDELQRLLAEVAAAEDRVRVLEDVYWAVLNSKEFVFNH